MLISLRMRPYVLRRGINLSFTDEKKEALFPIRLRAALADLVFPSLFTPLKHPQGSWQENEGSLRTFAKISEDLN